LAATLERALTTTGFTPGIASTASHHRSTTTIYYPDPGSTQAANTLAGILGDLPIALDSTVPARHLRVILGTDFAMPATLGTTKLPAPGDSSPTTTAPPAPHHPDPQPPDPTNSISDTGIPCVK
jgi:hypothetical protein